MHTTVSKDWKMALTYSPKDKRGADGLRFLRAIKMCCTNTWLNGTSFVELVCGIEIHEVVIILYTLEWYICLRREAKSYSFLLLYLFVYWLFGLIPVWATSRTKNTSETKIKVSAIATNLLMILVLSYIFSEEKHQYWHQWTQYLYVQDC